MAFAATFVKKTRVRNALLEIWKYTKLTGDLTGSITANSLRQIHTVDTASGGSGTVTRSTSSPKTINLSAMGAETSGVILLEGNDV